MDIPVEVCLRFDYFAFILPALFSCSYYFTKVVKGGRTGEPTLKSRTCKPEDGRLVTLNVPTAPDSGIVQIMYNSGRS